MTGALRTIHKASNMKKIDKDLPVVFLYGEEDPVGDYGKTIQALYNIYKANGMTNVTIKGYPNDRHEILNETDKELVENDILQYIAKAL